MKARRGDPDALHRAPLFIGQDEIRDARNSFVDWNTGSRFNLWRLNTPDWLSVRLAC